MTEEYPQIRKLSQRNWDWPVAEMRQWVEDGLTHEAIGLRLGVSSKQVSKVCAREGIQSQRRGPRSGPGHPGWKGGIQYDKHGYRLVWIGEDDPMACMARGRGPSRRAGYGYVPEHRLVMARHIERPLDSKEVVHHLNGDNSDNRIENLQLFDSNGEHLRHELTGKCPNWSEAGKDRLAAALKLRWDTHRRSQELKDWTSPLESEPDGEAKL